jgi:hypothetical protein
MNVLEVIVKLIIELVCIAFNFFGPPGTRVVDGIENLLWRLINQNGCGKILVLHAVFFLI